MQHGNPAIRSDGPQVPARRPLWSDESTSLDVGITYRSGFGSLTFSAHVVQRLETEADGAEQHPLVPAVVVHPPAVVQLDDVDLPLPNMVYD